jgi:hypothetical protein
MLRHIIDDDVTLCEGMLECAIVYIVLSYTHTKKNNLFSFFSIELQFLQKSSRSICEPIEELGDEDGFFSSPASSHYTFPEFLY